MPLKLFSRIRRHAAISTGNFDAIFNNISIAPMPPDTARLLDKINSPSVEIDEIALLIAALPEISAQILKTVNSSLFSLRSPVLSIQHAVTLLGLDRIRSIALSFAAVQAAPKPNTEVFNHQAFWTDSIIRALVAREFARHYCPLKYDDAFTAMLISDIALPVLLASWTEYYHPVVEEWCTSDKRLSKIEQNHFGWNHAQAGAWILQHWNFPEQLICFVGIHNANPNCISQLQLEDTVALPLIVASQMPSSLHSTIDRSTLFVQQATHHFSLSTDELSSIIDEVEQGFLDIYELMGLCQISSQPALEAIRTLLNNPTVTP